MPAAILLAGILLVTPFSMLPGDDGGALPAEAVQGSGDVEAPPSGPPAVLLPDQIALKLEASDVEEAWAELTPLASDAPPQLFFWDEETAQVRIARRPKGPLMICRGASARAATCTTRFSQPGETFVLDFEPGSALTGTCFEAGEPALRARVAVVPLGLSTPRPFTLPLERDGRLLTRSVTTDAKGSFSVPELAPGDYFLEITYPSGRVQLTEAFTIPRRRPATAPDGAPAATPVLSLGRFETDSGVAVEFVVTDLFGVPLADAEVGGGQGATPRDWTIFRGRTDGEGRAVVSGFQAESPLELTCQASGFEPLTRRFEAPPGWFDCALSPLVGLEGTVVDTEGEPIPGATVSVGEEPTLAVTREDGSFSFSELGAREQSLTIAAAGFEVEKLEITLSPQEALRRLDPVVLRAAPPVSGIVRERGTLEPVANAFVAVVAPVGAGSATTGEDGEFTLFAPSGTRLRLAATAPGFARAEKEIAPEELEADTPVVMELSKGGRIRVRVWNEEAGGPCQACTVWLDDASSTRLLTDERGEAVTEPLDPGTYHLQRPGVSHLGSQAVVQGGQEVRTAVVRAGETTLVEMGERVVFQTLVIRPFSPVGWKLAAESPSRYDVYWPQTDGSFQVQRKVEEELTVSLAGPRGPQGGGSEVLLATLPPVSSPGTETLELPETAIRGVVEREGEPVAAASVELVSVRDGAVWARTQSGDGGGFEVRYAPPGVYFLRIENQLLQTLSLGRGDHSELGRVGIQ